MPFSLQYRRTTPVNVAPSEKTLFGEWDSQRRKLLKAQQSADFTPVAPGRSP